MASSRFILANVERLPAEGPETFDVQALIDRNGIRHEWHNEFWVALDIPPGQDVNDLVSLCQQHPDDLVHELSAKRPATHHDEPEAGR